MWVPYFINESHVKCQREWVPHEFHPILKVSVRESDKMIVLLTFLLTSYLVPLWYKLIFSPEEWVIHTRMSDTVSFRKGSMLKALLKNDGSNFILAFSKSSSAMDIISQNTLHQW